MKHLKVINPDGTTKVSNLSSECEVCFKECNSVGKLIMECPKYRSKRRFGRIINTRGVTFLCCDKTKTTKLFRSKLEGLAYAFHDLELPAQIIKNQIKTVEQKRVNRLVHNLTSINAHNIQELYDIVPQEILTSNLKKQLKFIENAILKKPTDASKMFLRIAKHNIHMKSEFSIYKKMDRTNPTLDVRKHPIRKVILNVLHTFFVDLSDKNVFVNVEEFNHYINIDYETVQVAMYHLIENSTKYSKPNSKIEIRFEDCEEFLLVKFFTTSLFIEDDEIEKIFNEGYSGKNAKKTQNHGEGIGLWRVTQMLKLNHGFLTVNKGEVSESIMGIDFAKNEFVIKFWKPNSSSYL